MPPKFVKGSNIFKKIREKLNYKLVNSSFYWNPIYIMIERIYKKT